MKDYIGIARNKKDSENGYATKDYIGIAKKKSSNGDGNATNNNILKKRGTGNTNAGINVTNSQNPVITTTRKTGSVISPAEKLGREVSSRPDFIELSKPKERGVWDTDSRYKAVNDIGGWQEFLAQSDIRSVEENYKYMTEAEKGVYNYLYNTDGERAANEYLDELEYDLNERGMENFQAEYEQYAREHPIAASAGSVLTNGIGGIVGSADIIGQNVANVGRRIIGEETKPIDYNRPGQQGTVMTDAIRSTVSEELNKNGTLDEDVPLLGGLGLGDLYQLGMSMADSSAVALTGGSAGTAILGSAAASSSMRDASERGLSDRQILLTGIASGTAEALFEKVSIENLLKPKNGAAIGQAVKNILKQGGVEASEETFTTIANTISDGIINGDKSELNTAIDQYIQSGMTEDEAKKQAAKDWVKGLALDALGGFISGGVMGAGFEAGTRASYNSAGRRIVSNNSALNSLREAAGEYGVSLSENPSYREAGRTLRTVDFNRATGVPKSTAENITDTAEDSVAEPSRSMLRAVYDRDDGSYGDSYIVGVKNGGVEFEDGEVKSLADIRVDDPEAESVIRYAVEKGDSGNTVITAWNNGVMEGKRQNSTDFIYQFENAEEYGRLGAGLDYAKNSEAVNALTPTQIELAYNSGTGQSVRTLSQEVSEAKIKAEAAEKQAQAERISKATGRDIVFYESENASENGYFNPNDGKIYINSGSKNAVAQIISHELTHSIETSSSYGELSGLVFDRLKATGEDINALRTAKRELYERNGVTLADETAIDQEIVAEYVEKNLLTDEKSIRELVTRKRSLAQRISDWIDSVLAKLGNKDAGERAFLNRAKRLYAKALRETEVDRGGKVQYNIEKNNAGGDIDGREIYNYRNRYGQKKENTGRQTGMGNKEGRGRNGTGEEGGAFGRGGSNLFSEDSEGRRISPELSNRLEGTSITDERGNPVAVYHSTPNMDFTEFAEGDIGFHFGNENQAENRLKEKGDKGRFIKSYLNIKRPVEFKYDLPDWNASATAIHLWNDGIISFDEYLQVHKLYIEDKGDYNSKSSNKLREILAEKGYDGIVYENEIEGEGKSYIAFYPEQVVIFDDGKGENTIENLPVKKKFSISDPIERTENLVALHNLTQDKLEKSMALGGFPMPSIAVTKADIPHTNFGDITLVMDKSSIDPQANRKNKVYSADAWTPTFPAVEYEADEKVRSGISRKYYDLAGKIGYDAAMPLYNYVNSIDRELQYNGGEKGLIDSLKGNTDMMNVYLADSGKGAIEPIQREIRTKLDDETIREYDYLINSLGEDIINELTPRAGETAISKRKKWIEKYGDKASEAYRGYLRDVKGLDAEAIESEMNNNSKGKLAAKIATGVRKYMKNGAETVSAEYDSAATKNAILEATDKKGYEKWLNDLFGGIEKSTGIYNNKELYTPSGNRRSFAQTHYPVTLDNIVKAMAGQNNGDTKNISGFHGVKTLRAGTAERFKSIADMHKREGRLQNLTEEQEKAINDALGDRLSAIINKIYNSKPHGKYDNELIIMDSIGEIITEAAESGKYTVDNIEKIFSGYGYKIGNQEAMDIRDLLFDISQMPVNIFEAKPERAVTFDEVLAAVVPDNTDGAFIEKLKNAGVENVIKYKRDDEQSRINAVNSVEGAKFSISESYPDEIDEWDRNGRRDDELFVLGTTGDVIQGLGARENDIYIKSEKINKILVDHPEMTLDEIKKIPEILEYPIMILKSKNRANVGDNNTRLVVFGNIKAKNGNPILSVLDLSPIEKRTAISDMQKVNSAYTKTRNMKRFMESSEVLYADKKRTASLLRTMGFLAPIELQRVGSIGSIDYLGQNVNLKGVPFTDILGNDNQYSISDDEEMRELNTKEEKLATELSEIEQQYLIAQIEQGKKDAKELRIEKDKLKKQMESLEKRNSRKAKTQLKQYQRKLDKMVDRIAYKDGQLKTLKQNKNDAVLAARIAEGRAWSEKYGRDISELQEKISRKNAELKAVRQRRDELLAKKDEKFRKYKETRRKSILRGQIKSLVRDFNARLDRPNQKKYIPKELVTAVIDLTSAINVENDSASPKIQERLEHMKAVYDRYENDPDYAVYDDFVSEMIDQVTKEIGDTPLRDMTESQLRMVYDTLTAFSRAVTDAQRFAALQYDKSIYQAGTDAINEIKNSKLRFKGDGVNNFVNWLLTPERFFNRLGGYRKNGIWEKVGKSLNESTQKAIGVSREFYYKFREFSDGSYADSLADQKNIYDVGLRDENGNAIKVTRGQMISIYMHLTSEDNRRAIQYGGLSVPDMNAYYKGNTKNAFGKNKIRTVGLSQEMRTLRADYVSTQEKLQELLTKYTKDGEVQYNSINEIDTQMIDQYQKNIEDIEAQMETSLKKSDNYIAGIEENINKFLTDEDKKFIKTLRDWYKYSADKINEVTMRMYGIKRATVDNYYTIHRDPDLLAKEFSDIVMDFSLESWGSLKERVPSVQPILLTDVMFDVSDHANELSQYYGYVEMMRDFNKLYNTRSGNTSVKEAVAHKLGAGNTKIAGVTGGQYIENLMADIVGARAKQGSFLSILRRNVTRSALTVNIRVAFSQLSGTLSAPAEVGWKATLKGIKKGTFKAFSTKYKEELARLNEFYYERYKGEGGMREFSEVKVADNVLDKIWNKIDDKTKGWLLNWSRTVDAYSTAVMYSMAEEYVKDTLEISPKDGGYLDEVNRKFTDILIHTQPQSDTALRSDLFRETREGYSFVTLFKSQSNQFFNMLYDASARVWTYQNAVKNGDKSVTKDDLYRAKRDLANAATTVIIGGSFGFAVTRFIANAILRHMDDYRDDDDEVTAQSIALGIMNDSISSFAGILPLGEEIYDLIMASVSDRTYYGISEAGLQSLNDTFNGIVSFSGDVKDDEVTLESFTKLIKAAAPMLMIPYNSVNTIIEAAKGYINDIPSGNFLTFEYGAERSSTTQGRRMYEAVFEGDMEKYAAVRDEMIQDGVEKGKTEEEAVKDMLSAFKRAVKDSFAEGDIDAKGAEDILKKYVYDGEDAKNDAYWTIREWEAGGDFSRYDDLTEAVLKADGGAYKKALEELESHGTKESSIKSAITKAVKEAYLRGELSVSEAKNKLRVYNGLSSSEAIEKIREWREAA